MKTGLFLKRRLALYLVLYLSWICILFGLTGGFRGLDAWLTGWGRWDAEWYRRIWLEGYQADDPKTLAFPPGYPGLVGGISAVTGISFMTSALFVNVIAFGAALGLAVEMLTKRLSLKNPVMMFCLGLTSPPAFLVFTGYSDSVFTLIVWCLLALALFLPNSNWARVAEFALMALAPWVRLAGFALAGWLLLRRWSAFAVLSSLAGWLMLNSDVSGDAFYFLKAQRIFSMPEGHLLDGIAMTWQSFSSPRLPVLDSDWDQYLTMYLLPGVLFAAFLGVALWFWRVGNALVAVTILGLILISHNQLFWRSVLRYDFPLWICLCCPLLFWGKRSPSRGLVTGIAVGALGTVQFLLQIYLANIFHSGGWAF